jgi:hypothetical protein
MKKLLAFVIVLGVAGFLVYRFVLTSAAERSCERLANLCGQKTAVDACVRTMKEVGKTSKESASKFDGCMGDAKSCAEGLGCVAGAGIGAAGSMINDFLKGLGEAVKK